MKQSIKPPTRFWKTLYIIINRPAQKTGRHFVKAVMLCIVKTKSRESVVLHAPKMKGQLDLTVGTVGCIALAFTK